MDSPAVSSRLFSTTLTFRTPQENHIVSVPFETIEKTKKCFFSLFFVSPGNTNTIKNLIPGWTTIVKLLKQVKNWQSPSRDPWSNCLIYSREDDKSQTKYYSGRQKDNSKTICRHVGYFGVIMYLCSRMVVDVFLSFTVINDFCNLPSIAPAPIISQTMNEL